MGREGDNRELNDLVRRLRDLTDKNFGDLDQFSTWGREMVAAADAIEAQAKRIAELEAALEDERERCAKIAERFLSNNEPVRLTASSIAAAIRGRNNER